MMVDNRVDNKKSRIMRNNSMIIWNFGKCIIFEDYGSKIIFWECSFREAYQMRWGYCLGRWVRIRVTVWERLSWGFVSALAYRWP
jgi:hypothetical protein